MIAAFASGPVSSPHTWAGIVFDILLGAGVLAMCAAVPLGLLLAYDAYRAIACRLRDRARARRTERRLREMGL